MIVEDNGAYYVVRSVFVDDIVGPFDNKEDAENWLRCYYQTERIVEEEVHNEN